MRGRAVLILIAEAFALAACVTRPEYGPINGSRYYGYADTPNNVGGHTIRVVVPSETTNPRLAFDFWDRRAAELCAPRGYRKQIAIAERRMLYVQGGAPTTLNYEVAGEVFCDPDPSVDASAQPSAATSPEN